jgi:hypothetical protein
MQQARYAAIVYKRVEANRDKLTMFYPLRRLGQPHDVAPMTALRLRRTEAGSPDK